jgi:pyruvate dehydrogenase E2 component (dihydrolipoamide acetyltransferase)
MTGVALEPGRGEPAIAKLSLMRRSMVRRTLEGAAVPCFYLRVAADVTDLIAARRELREERGTAPSVNDFIVRAVAIGLRRHPAVNSAYADGEVATYPRVNVGVAVAIEGGLVVPAIYDADLKDVHEISRAVREVADLAERRKLSRELLADPTFTVSNLGMYGMTAITPVINAPQAAILGVGAVREVLARVDGDIVETQLMTLTLSCDHRILYGAEASQFLSRIRDLLEQPLQLAF